MNKVRICLTFASYTIMYLRQRDIDILNIEYRKEGNVYTIYARDLEKLPPSVYKIESYYGIAKLVRMVRAHSSFLISTFLQIALMIFLSHCLFDVEVIHSNADVRELIMDELYDRGVKPFTLKKSFREIQEIKDSIKREHQSDIEWLEINDEGMRYVVRVEERIITRPDETPSYCNVISKKDAIVLKTVAPTGQVRISPNDFVRKGDILISGQVTYNDEVKSTVCANGQVFGNTWYKVAIAIPITYTEIDYTDREKGNIGIEFGSTYNRIFKIHYDKYSVDKKPLFSLGKFTLYKENVREYTENEKTRSDEEALEEAIEQAREKLLVKLDDQSQILSEKVLQSSIHDSIISLEVFFSVSELISETVEGSALEETPSVE